MISLLAAEALHRARTTLGAYGAPARDPEELAGALGVGKGATDLTGVTDLELALVIAHEATRELYGVAVGGRWSDADGRLRVAPVRLTADAAVRAVALAGFEVALLVPSALLPVDDAPLALRRTAALFLVEASKEPTP